MRPSLLVMRMLFPSITETLFLGLFVAGVFSGALSTVREGSSHGLINYKDTKP
jgi:hypothetical protein